jgi:hypothetical protein
LSASELTRIRRGVALFNGKKPVLPAATSFEDKLEQTYYGAAPILFEGKEIKPACCEQPGIDLPLILTLTVPDPLGRSVRSRSNEGFAQLHEYIKQRVAPTIRSGIRPMREMRREFAEFRKTLSARDASRDVSNNMYIIINTDQFQIELSDGTVIDVLEGAAEFYAPPGDLKIYASNVFALGVFGSVNSITLVPENLQIIEVLLLSSSDTEWSSTSVSDLPNLRAVILGTPCSVDAVPSLTSVSLANLPSIADNVIPFDQDISGLVLLSGNLLTQAAAEAVAGDLIVNGVTGGTLAILNQYDISGNTYTLVTLDISGNLLTLQGQYGWAVVESLEP